jgi:DNA-binding NarL/FixJ family response regulator
MAPTYGNLTDVEKKVLQLLDQGKTRREIAAAMNTSLGNVHRYITRAWDKMLAYDNAGAIAKAKELGQI